MKRTLAMGLAAVVLVALSGCKEDDAPVQTTDWYKEHAAERKAMLAKCNENPGERMATPNCVNAARADSATTWGARGGGIKPVTPPSVEELKKK